MVSFDAAAFIALVVTLGVAVLLNRKKLSFERFGFLYASMYRTQAGIATMDKIAKRHRSLFVKLTPWIIALGFIGMAFVTFDLARSLLMVLSNDSAPSVGVVLPFKARSEERR